MARIHSVLLDPPWAAYASPHKNLSGHLLLELFAPQLTRRSRRHRQKWKCPSPYHAHCPIFHREIGSFTYVLRTKSCTHDQLSLEVDTNYLSWSAYPCHSNHVHMGSIMFPGDPKASGSTSTSSILFETFAQRPRPCGEETELGTTLFLKIASEQTL